MDTLKKFCSQIDLAYLNVVNLYNCVCVCQLLFVIKYVCIVYVR